MSLNKQVYINEKQKQFLISTASTKIFLGGRGSGKTTEIGYEMGMRSGDMPGATFFLSSTTYNQLLTKTLKPILEAVNRMGFIEGIHYVVGQKPPKWFKMPISKPGKWEYFITFYTGFCVELLSLDRPDKARGGSYQGGWIDEAALVKEEHYTRVLRYATRGLRHKFKSPHYGQIGMYTSVPWKPSGFWIFKYEEKAIANPEEFFWLESTAYDNVAVLGEETLKTWERDTPYLEFQIEVMNKRVRAAQDAFYHRFDPEHHCYQPKYQYGKGKQGIHTKQVIDIKKDALLDISMDFSGWFNCMSVWQESRGTERMVRSYSVKQDKKVNDLIDLFCREQSEHKFKYVRVWGEPRGHDKNPTGEDIYTQIQKRFEYNGWQCEIKAHAGRTTNHKERHTFTTDVLSEEYKHYPQVRINEEYCKDVIIALQITEITPDFKKDKSKERDRNFPQEHAPHFTDTFDYYLVQKYMSRFSKGRRAGRAFTR